MVIRLVRDILLEITTTKHFQLDTYLTHNPTLALDGAGEEDACRWYGDLEKFHRKRGDCSP